jgi:hypothetical protein
MAKSGAERQADYVKRLRAGSAPAKPVRKPQDRRSQLRQWVDAVAVLERLLDGWQAARDALPENLSDGAYAFKLDAVLELRSEVEALRAAADDLPKGFGRD